MVFVRVEAHAAGGVSSTALEPVLVPGTSNASALCTSSTPLSSALSSTSFSSARGTTSDQRTSAAPDVSFVNYWWFIPALALVALLVAVLLCLGVWLVRRRLRARRNKFEVMD